MVGMMFSRAFQQPAQTARRHGLAPHPKIGHSGGRGRATIPYIVDRVYRDATMALHPAPVIPLLAATCVLHPGGWRMNPR